MAVEVELLFEQKIIIITKTRLFKYIEKNHLQKLNIFR